MEVLPIPVKAQRMNADSQTYCSGKTVTAYIDYLRRKVKSLQAQLHRNKTSLLDCRQERDAYKDQLANYKGCNCSFLTERQKEFVKTQVKAISVHKKGMRWSWSDKSRALTLFLKSPMAYQHEASQWRLPHKNTLLKLVRPIFRQV
jgi:hypothetical protein